MASKVTQRERLDREFAILATRDPEVFFEAMLISLRENTIEPLDNKRLRAQKAIFKQWFTQYERHLRRDIENGSEAINDAFHVGSRLGKLAILSNIPTRRTLFGRKLDKKAIAARIKELSDA